jgi:hypothetical protein
MRTRPSPFSLKRAGIESYWPVHHGTTLSLYYADPDDNRMEFQVDCGTLEATALMRTPAYAANPVGVMYDPDSLLARFEAGGDEEALLAQPAGSPSPIPAAHGMTYVRFLRSRHAAVGDLGLVDRLHDLVAFQAFLAAFRAEP